MTDRYRIHPTEACVLAALTRYAAERRSPSSVWPDKDWLAALADRLEKHSDVSPEEFAKFNRELFGEYRHVDNG